MMMAPDYAWWHGFYECKLRFANDMEEANHLIETGQKAYVYPKYPNATGDTTKPVKIFGNRPVAVSGTGRNCTADAGNMTKKYAPPMGSTAPGPAPGMSM
jgi:hypothetical protein